MCRMPSLLPLYPLATRIVIDLCAISLPICCFLTRISNLYYLRVAHIPCISTLYKVETRTLSTIIHFFIFPGYCEYASLLLYRWRRKESVHIKGLLISGELWLFRKKPRKEARLSLPIQVDGEPCFLIRSSLFSWWQVFEGKSDLQRALRMSLNSETRYEVIIST